MDRNALWNLFMETGAPEAYLLYTQSKQTAEGEM